MVVFYHGYLNIIMIGSILSWLAQFYHGWQLNIQNLRVVVVVCICQPPSFVFKWKNKSLVGPPLLILFSLVVVLAFGVFFKSPSPPLFFVVFKSVDNFAVAVVGNLPSTLLMGKNLYIVIVAFVVDPIFCLPVVAVAFVVVAFVFVAFVVIASIVVDFVVVVFVVVVKNEELFFSQ